MKAVEAATLKIQSTFRGKKIRSKVTPKPAVADKPDEQQQKSVDLSAKQVNNQSAGRQKSSSKSEEQQESRSSSSTTTTKDELELSTKVAEMQVQDNTNNQMENQKTNVSKSCKRQDGQQQLQEAASEGAQDRATTT